MWDLPGLGIEPMSPALAGRSLTTGHQGSPKRHTVSLQTVAHKEGAVAVVQLLSCVRFFVTPWTAARQASLSFTISWSLLKLVH